MARDDEYSDSEDEGDDRHDETSYREPSERKRPRLAKDGEESVKTGATMTHTPSPAPSATSSGGGGEGHAPSDKPAVAAVDAVHTASSHAGLRPEQSGNVSEEMEQEPTSTRYQIQYTIPVKKNAP